MVARPLQTVRRSAVGRGIAAHQRRLHDDWRRRSRVGRDQAGSWPARRAWDTSALIAPNRGSKRSSGSRGYENGISISAMIRPGRGDITSTRVLRNTASEIEWVMNSPAKLLGLEQPQRLLVQAFPGDLVDRSERLVEQHDRRLQRQCPGQRATHPHPARQATWDSGVRSRRARRVRWLVGRPGGVHPAPKPWSSASNSTLPRTVRHGISVGSWNT